MSRITYKTALEWIIKHDDMKWIKEDKPVATALVKFVSEIYRVDVPKIVRTLRKDMGLDKTEAVLPKVKAPAKAKAAKVVKAAKPAKPAKAPAKAAKAPVKAAKPAKSPVKKPTKADRQAKLAKAHEASNTLIAKAVAADPELAAMAAAAPIEKTPVTAGTEETDAAQSE